jgi:hypothetical protein
MGHRPKKKTPIQLAIPATDFDRSVNQAIQVTPDSNPDFTEHSLHSRNRSRIPRLLYPDDTASLVLERSICDSLYDD